ncbi:MAG: TRC40/GET3/ArsA family transport-energizing ATPase [Calditrichaeota bacterium]|nr:TRC40/GET3/ArsA family transport-energizing ATPase [Calditrichota bacterium]
MASRVLLFTGKGGVGKTTCAAATAIRAARSGYRTLVMSSDPAHSLSDALNHPIGPEPVEILPRLHAQEVDLYYSMKKYWGNIRDLLLMVFKWQGVHDIAAEELAAIPGMGEASALLWLDLFYHSDEYDLIIVDSAPTGETLTFLTLPQVTEWWLTKAFPFQSLIFQTVGFGIRKTTGIPLDKGYRELKELFEKLRNIHSVLSDSQISSVRLVMNPEKMVIQEAKRAFTYLQLYGYGVDAVIVNRIFPDELQENPQWARYIQAQSQYLTEIESSFSPLPIFKVPHLREEVFGVDLLETVGQQIYGDADPTQVFYNEPTYQIVKNDRQFELVIRLPFVQEEDLQVNQFGDELVIQIQNQRRNYFLPRFLEYYQINHYELAENKLRIFFVERSGEQQLSR